MPSVSLIVPTVDGAAHLPTLLDSVAALDYPRRRLETIVVDNGSRDGSFELLRGRYPWVRVLPQDENLGFAEAVNVAARTSGAECIALANNDMRLHPGWLQELVRVYEDGTRCVAGVILDWDGERVQFADGIVNFHGAAAQVPFGERLEDVEIEDGRELPFACGGSMLIDRKLFLDLGGFDAAFFAYFEDVDLGWRLRLAGHDVRLAAGSRAFHRHHSTGSLIPLAERLRLYEANWLRTVLKNVGDQHLARVLGASLLLLDERARRTSGAESAARAAAARDVVRDLPRLRRQRRDVQARRKRSDSEIFARFGRPFFPALDDVGYLDAVASVVGSFDLEEVFPVGPRVEDERRLLVEAHRSMGGRVRRRIRQLRRR